MIHLYRTFAKWKKDDSPDSPLNQLIQSSTNRYKSNAAATKVSVTIGKTDWKKYHYIKNDELRFSLESNKISSTIQYTMVSTTNGKTDWNKIPLHKKR